MRQNGWKKSKDSSSDPASEPRPLTEIEAFNLAVRLLARQARTEKELSDKLAARGASDSTIAATVATLKTKRFLDDAVIAQRWVETRGQSRGSRALGYEMKRRGIDDNTAGDALSERTDDDEWSAARATAVRRVGDPPSDRTPQAKKRLTDYLMRRGFAYATIRRVVSDLYASGAADDDELDEDEFEDES